MTPLNPLIRFRDGKRTDHSIESGSPRREIERIGSDEGVVQAAVIGNNPAIVLIDRNCFPLSGRSMKPYLE
jgi:hypothetical protein